MIEWLEGYLNRGNKTIFMVTHDRFFLDKVCNVILELDDQTIYTYRGNYAYYLEKRQERMDNLRAEIQHSKICIEENLTGCAGNHKLVAIKHAIVKRHSMNLKSCQTAH